MLRGKFYPSVSMVQIANISAIKRLLYVTNIIVIIII